MKAPIAFLLLLMAACGSSGNTTPPEPGPPPPFIPGVPEQTENPVKHVATLTPPEPLLIPGDILSLSVFRQPDLALEARIANDGTIHCHLIGPVQAVGRTSAEVAVEIRERLEKDYLNNPSVSVTVKEFAQRQVFVLGAVQTPGGYDILPTGGMTLLQLVAAGGGYTDRAYKEYAQLVRIRGRQDREVLRLSLVDLERRVAQGKPEADLWLQPGDLLVIPSAARVVNILGEVAKPGQIAIHMDTRLTVMMAISQAGSYSRYAATGSVQIHRTTPDGKAEKLPVDLNDILSGKSPDVELRPGDVVWVPERGIF